MEVGHYKFMNSIIHKFAVARSVLLTSIIICIALSLLSLAITLVAFWSVPVELIIRLIVVSLLIPIVIGFPVVYAMLGLIRQLDSAEREMRELATKDHLTGIWNRGYFIDAADKWDKQSARHNRPLSLMIIDFDQFKKINDTYGHVAGDEALRVFAKEAQEVIRTSDILGRIGGEEFAILLPDCPGREACLAAERLREAVSMLSIDTDLGKLSFTISIGVASHPSNPGYDHMAAAADKALYAAKSAGRNRVRVNGNSCLGCEKASEPCVLRLAVS